VAVESYGTGAPTDDTLFGLSAYYRLGPLAPNATFLFKPAAHDDLERSRWFGGLGLRSYFDVLGVEFAYGVGMHAEARLEDHYWLGVVTPLEIGAVLYDEHSFRIELLGGARYAFAGDLINHFLIDPNGFDNEDARDGLDEARHGDPWRSFVRLSFGRKLD
jgi:hypothetical protein